MKFSAFGQKFGQHSGITELMDDLNEGINSGKDILMLGGGNPAQIPEMQSAFEQELQQMLSNGELVASLGNYDGPQGKDSFTQALADLLQQEYGWSIGKENIAITNGSQSAFFYLFNLFAGPDSQGRNRKVVFPLAPEYIGYADAPLAEGSFQSFKPAIEQLPDRQFKYHVDFDNLVLDDDAAMICVSRPTNPTGNVLTDDEVRKLDELARQHDIPLVIDNAYGTPFPDIIFEPVEPFWNSNTILCMSLSKLGLPGARTGIVIASEEIVTALSNISGILSLAPGSIGPALAQRLARNGKLLELSEQVIRPFYQDKAQKAVAQLQAQIEDERFRIHKPEGAIFLWLWFDQLPITSYELYQRLKQRGVLVVPGHYFFPGLSEEDKEGWPHHQECIRMNYSQPDDIMQRGIQIIAEEVNLAYQQG